MRIKIKFKPNSTKISSVMNCHINGFINRVLGENNKWHGSFSPYAVSPMHGGVLQPDKTIQYPNGGYIIVSSENLEFIDEFLRGLVSQDSLSILSMEYDTYEFYDPEMMSKFTIVYCENVYLHKKTGESNEEYTFKSHQNFLDILRENSVKKLVRDGMKERTANSLTFSPFHPEDWKVKMCKYKIIDNQAKIHPVSNIALVIKGSKEARKKICEMGFGNSTGFGFGFASLDVDKKM